VTSAKLETVVELDFVIGVDRPGDTRAEAARAGGIAFITDEGSPTGISADFYCLTGQGGEESPERQQAQRDHETSCGRHR
jgi:hypothetical protein